MVTSKSTCVEKHSNPISLLVFFSIHFIFQLVVPHDKKVFSKSLLVLLTFGVIAESHAEEFGCLIEPTQMVELGSSVAGRVTKVYVKRGEVVKKMQTLALLESSAEKSASDLARYKAEQVGPSKMAENKIEFSKKKLSRRQEMASQKLLSLQDSEDAESELRLAEAELLIAKENKRIAQLELQQQNSLLNLRTITSPVDGVVVDQSVFSGEVFEPGSTRKYILKVAEMNPLKVRVILPRNLFGKYKYGMVGKVTPELPQQGPYSAKIIMIDKLIDAASGTFVVFLEIQNPKLDIPSGLKCKVLLPEK
ncbi:MAG: efflux RND transporter periplasmic adaptor subunit [Methylophilaceae bacterium]